MALNKEIEQRAVNCRVDFHGEYRGIASLWGAPRSETSPRLCLLSASGQRTLLFYQSFLAKLDDLSKLTQRALPQSDKGPL